MRRKPVASSNVLSVGYARKSRTLEIEFAWGGIYHYFAVPRRLHQRLMRATSKGAFVNTHIKDRFDYARAEP